MRLMALVVALLVLVSASASAQPVLSEFSLRQAQGERVEGDRSAAFVGGSVSAANIQSRTDVAYSGSFGFRFSRIASFVIEATGVPEVRSAFPTDRPIILSTGTSTSVAVTNVQIYPGPFFSNPGGRIVLLTNAVRIDIPTTSARVTPFFAAGGGVAQVRRTADFTYPIPILAPSGVPAFPIQIRPVTERITSSSTDLALTLGGGVGVGVASSLFLDVDLRLFRLLGDDDQNLGRFGVGVRYQF